MASLRRRWAAQLRGTGRRVALVDAHDPRVEQAARALAESGTLVPLRVGSGADAAGKELRPGGNASVLLPEEVWAHPGFEALTATVAERRRLSPTDAGTLRSDSLHIGVAALALGMVDACVAGSIRTTADVIRSGLHCLGMRPGTLIVTSSFLMVMPDGRPLVFADCGVVPEPSPEQLAEIARAASVTYRTLTAGEPAVAMLSFSTRGSASNPRVDVVRQATALLHQQEPELVVDGELQVDAALVPRVAAAKSPGSPVAGRANVLVFPDLGAGNIAYKLVQHLAGASAVGPLLQGLAAPLHDLSRGCRVDDVITVATVGALQATRTIGNRPDPAPLPSHRPHPEPP